MVETSTALRRSRLELCRHRFATIGGGLVLCRLPFKPIDKPLAFKESPTCSKGELQFTSSASIANGSNRDSQK